MKIFLSWSGDRSKAVAVALKDWLQNCIQQLDPWVSSADIEKGARWFEEIEGALTAADGQGIFCVTPENLASPWLNFEAGFVASKGGKGRVCVLLIDVSSADIQPPLSLFQVTNASRDDFYLLVKTLNEKVPIPVSERVLKKAFEKNWEELEAAIAAAIKLRPSPVVKQPSDGDRLAELITTTRRLEQAVAEQAAHLKQLVETRSPRSLSDLFPDQKSGAWNVSARSLTEALANDPNWNFKTDIAKGFADYKNLAPRPRPTSELDVFKALQNTFDEQGAGLQAALKELSEKNTIVEAALKEATKHDGSVRAALKELSKQEVNVNEALEKLRKLQPDVRLFSDPPSSPAAVEDKHSSRSTSPDYSPPLGKQIDDSA